MSQPRPQRRERYRVTWSRRRERPWCPGATREPARVPLTPASGWTGFLHVQGMRKLLERARHPPRAALPAPLPAERARPGGRTGSPSD